MSARPKLPVAELATFVTGLFAAAGLSDGAAARVAGALMDAEMAGKTSHGLILAEANLRRLIAGSMTGAERATIVSERGATVVMDAADMNGLLAAEHAMEVAVARARDLGIAAVAVRRAYHFGVAGRYAKMAADAGCIGIATCNTRVVASAPGGTDRLVGTNPLAIAIPTAGEPAILLDMATTEGSMGKVRHALAVGDRIPEGWALGPDGKPTTDPAAALKGTLQPLGGAKGFGLALVIDMMSGLLASGGWGPALGTMQGDPSEPYNSSFLFMALDVEHFRDLGEFRTEAEDAARRVRTSRPAAGADRVMTPGERSYRAMRANDGTLTIAPRLARTLAGLARVLGVETPVGLTAAAAAQRVGRSG